MIGGSAALLGAVELAALPEPRRVRARRRYIDGAFGQIHLREARAEAGSVNAPPLILFHQSPLSGRMFDNFLPFLAEGRNAIAVDTPGYGESDRPINRPTAEEYVETMMNALSTEYGSEIDILGYHSGATFAALAAVGFQNLVQRLVLISVPFFDEHRRMSIRNSFSEELTFEDDGSYLLPLWESSFGVRPYGQSRQDIARVVAEKQRGGAYRDWAYLSIFDQDMTSTLKSITQPTLVVIPHDGLENESMAAAVTIESAKTLSYPNYGYGLFDAFPKTLAKRVLQFLDGGQMSDFSNENE